MPGELVGRVIWWAVAVGAACGAPCRYLLDAAVSSRLGRDRPWGTLSVNLLGSAAAGLLAGVSVHADLGATLATLLGAGFLGAFTTASAFAFEVVSLAEASNRRDAVLVVLLSVGVGLALAVGGFRLGLVL